MTTGATLDLSDSELEITAATVTKDNVALQVISGGNVFVRRSILRVIGNDTGTANFATGRYSAVVYSNASTATFESSVLHSGAGPESFGLVADGSAGAVTLINDTVFGSSYSSGGGAGVRVDASLRMMNTAVEGFAMALNLNSLTALGSLIFNNAFDNSGSSVALANCNGVPSELVNLNVAPLTSCNQSAATWAGNKEGYCWLTNPAALDYTLITGVANPCVDSGALSTPAGVASSKDLLGGVRPLGAGVDIGADEGK